MNFTSYWQYTDIITKFLFFALITLSILSWITGILRIYQSYRVKNQVATELLKAVKAQSEELVTLPMEQRKTATEQTLLQHIARFRFEVEKGLSILGTTASIAPFIGLFGTVWGIFHALHGIGESGQAGLSQVAGPVGEALIMTGLGLAVAIPAVVFYNIAVRCNRRTLFIANDTAYSILGNTAKRGSHVHEKLKATNASHSPSQKVQEYSSSTVS